MSSSWSSELLPAVANFVVRSTTSRRRASPRCWVLISAFGGRQLRRQVDNFASAGLAPMLGSASCCVVASGHEAQHYHVARHSPQSLASMFQRPRATPLAVCQCEPRLRPRGAANRCRSVLAPGIRAPTAQWSPPTTSYWYTIRSAVYDGPKTDGMEPVNRATLWHRSRTARRE